MLLRSSLTLFRTVLAYWAPSEVTWAGTAAAAAGAPSGATGAASAAEEAVSGTTVSAAAAMTRLMFMCRSL